MNKISKKAIYLSLALLTLSDAHASNIEMNTAHIQAMDKITGRVSELNIQVNGLANFGTFSILVRKCVTKSPEETPENTAFIDVVDNYKSENPVNIFKGWMFSSTPGINGVEHPIYDIWLLKCYNSDKSKHKVLTEEQLKFRDELPLVRQIKQEQNIKLSALDEVSEEDIKLVEEEKEVKEEKEETSATTQDVAEVAKNENEIIKINVDTKTDEVTEAIEEDFIAEGEEVIAETIVVDNETVAQDEENQKAVEEALNDDEEIVEEIIIDEVQD